MYLPIFTIYIWLSLCLYIWLSDTLILIFPRIKSSTLPCRKVVESTELFPLGRETQLVVRHSGASDATVGGSGYSYADMGADISCNYEVGVLSLGWEDFCIYVSHQAASLILLLYDTESRFLPKFWQPWTESSEYFRPKLLLKATTRMIGF